MDPTFDARDGANGAIETLILQPDGRVLVAGDFTVIDGVNRTRLARLSNPDAALQRLEASGQGINFIPAGSMPMLVQVHLESSLNGFDYATLRNASWNGQAWQIPGIVLGPGWNWIRARGTSALGFPLHFVQQVYVSEFQPPPSRRDDRLKLLRQRQTGQPRSDLLCSGTNPETRVCRSAQMR